MTTKSHSKGKIPRQGKTESHKKAARAFIKIVWLATLGVVCAALFVLCLNGNLGPTSTGGIAPVMLTAGYVGVMAVLGVFSSIIFILAEVKK